MHFWQLTLEHIFSNKPHIGTDCLEWDFPTRSNQRFKWVQDFNTQCLINTAHRCLVKIGATDQSLPRTVACTTVQLYEYKQNFPSTQTSTFETKQKKVSKELSKCVDMCQYEL
jgi:hypothetical protein